MDATSNQWSFREGTDVFGSDGDKVGKVIAVHDTYVVVEKGFFFPTDYFIPTSAFANVEGDGAYLNVTKDEALNSGWDEEPASGYADIRGDINAYGEQTGAGATVTAGQTADQQPTSGFNRPAEAGGTYLGTEPVHAATVVDDLETANPVSAITQPAGSGGTYLGNEPASMAAPAAGSRDATMGADMDDFDTPGGMGGASGGTTRVAEGDTLRVPVHQEELTATTRPVEVGEVRIDKDVVEEERLLEVPVTEERVRVTHRAVDREGLVDDTAFEGGTIAVPVMGEEVDLEKRTRVAEEVDIEKEAVQRTETVGGTVRREEVRVDDATADVQRRTETTGTS